MRTQRWMLACCGALVACGGDDNPLLPSAADFATTSEGTGSGDSADDSAAPDRAGATLNVRVEGDRPGLMVNLHTVVLGAASDAPHEIADGVPVDGGFALDVAPPDERWFRALDPETQGFLALPFAYIDDDENGVHTPEEQYVGLGLEGAMYIEGVPGSVLSAAGFVSGWNAVVVDLETAEVVRSPAGLSELVCSPQLIPQDRFLVEAAMELPVAGHRVAMVPGTVLSGEVTGPLIYDQPASETVQLAVDGPSPDEHLQDLGADGTQYRDWRYAVESLLVYTDSDASGGYSSGDAVVGSLCAMGAKGVFQHTSEPDKAFEALHLATNHIIPAWSLYLGAPEDGEFVRIDDAGAITLSDNCQR